MRRLKALFVLVLLNMVSAHAETSSGDGLQLAPACRPDLSSQEGIREDKFVAIGGIEQWITVNGEDCANPVVLFVHGGPGNPLSPYADSLFAGWEKTFTLVQWDQRGAGRTYGRNEPVEEPSVERYKATELTMDLLVTDGIEVAEYLKQRLGKDKIILTGSSWGSALAVHMVKRRPDLFHAYVGLSQLVHYRDNLIASYKQVVVIARAAKDMAVIPVLETLGPPPWTNPRSFGKLRRVIRKYEAASSGPSPSWAISPEYATPEERAAYIAGEDLSFVKYVGLDGDGFANWVDLPALGMDFPIPVFMVHGANDLLTTPKIARAYFDGIAAPEKEFVLLPRTGHDQTFAMLEAQFWLLRERVLPWIGSR